MLQPREWDGGYQTFERTNGPVGTDQRFVLPRRCVLPDDGYDQGEEISLPLGCANDLNLVQQVENKRELIRGTPMGPAAAAPVVTAAQKRLYDDKEVDERQKQLQQEQDQQSSASDMATTGGARE